MKGIFTSFLIMLLSLPAILSAQVRASVAPSVQPVILGYYSSVDKNVTPSDINYSLFTHICHACSRIDPETIEIKMNDGTSSADLIARAHAAGVKVLLAIGGDAVRSRTFNAIAYPQNLDRFVDSVLKIVARYHYDGVDLDWIFPTEGEKDEFDNLYTILFALRRGIDQKLPGGLLTMFVSPMKANSELIDPKCIPLVDFVNVMTYNFRGPWSGDWGHKGYNAALFREPSDKAEDYASMAESMDYWTKIKKWPKEKLVPGIPCFGHGFHGIRFHFNSREQTQHATIMYKEIPALIVQGWKRSWDPVSGVPYLTNPEGSEFISYDDPQSAALKGEWIRKEGYRGVFFEDITEDSINKDNVIVHAARNGYAGVK